MEDEEQVVPDTKDWTWVLERSCPACGFDATTVRRAELKNRVYANSRAWPSVLGRPGAGTRPRPGVWSPLEYACHVRDVHRVFGDRVRLMLDEQDPLFDDWDQDRAALQDGYGAQDPVVVARQLVEAADAVSHLYASVPDASWERPGRRSNGSVFTVDSIARYHLHDVEHHLFDVSG